MLLRTPGVSLLGSILGGKGINRAGEGTIRAGYGNKKFEKHQQKTKRIFNATSSFN